MQKKKVEYKVHSGSMGFADEPRKWAGMTLLQAPWTFSFLVNTYIMLHFYGNTEKNPQGTVDTGLHTVTKSIQRESNFSIIEWHKGK